MGADPVLISAGCLGVVGRQIADGDHRQIGHGKVAHSAGQIGQQRNIGPRGLALQLVEHLHGMGGIFGIGCRPGGG